MIKTVHLTADDFKHGTLRIRQPCKLVLQESVQFNPNRPVMLDSNGRKTRSAEKEAQIDPNRDRDWMPLPDQKDYFDNGRPSHAYDLGFFAAITIEHKDGCIIDLNGFTLGCHTEFALQQRFHALIELADQPFIPSQGPADFGSAIRSAGRVWIRNGSIGRSSHHGIHGNGMTDILITNLVLHDYEVAAISLNGGRRIFIEDCRCEGTHTEIPILGTYSASRFARLMSGEVIEKLPAKATKDLKQGREALNCALDSAFNEIIFGVATKSGTQVGFTTDRLFRNEARVTDGNAYGLAMHARGVLVGAFMPSADRRGSNSAPAKALETSDILISNVNVVATRGHIREIPALAKYRESDSTLDVDSADAVYSTSGDAPFHDAAGSIFQFFPASNSYPNDPEIEQPGNMDSTGNASLTVLGAVQIEIARLLHDFPGKLPRLEARNTIPPEIVKWSESAGRLKLKQDQGELRSWSLVNRKGKQLAQFEVRANGDTMHHVNKGVLGVFLQGVNGLVLDDVQVSGAYNAGFSGSQIAGNYTDGGNGGHAGQLQQVGYGGADTRGVYIGASSNVTLRGAKTYGVQSHYGSASGIEVAAGTANVVLEHCHVQGVRAGASRAPGDALELLPNLPPEAKGVRVAPSCMNVALCGCRVVGEVSSPSRAESTHLDLDASVRMV